MLRHFPEAINLPTQFPSLALFFYLLRQAYVGVATITSPIGPSDIGNHRFGMFVLSLKRSGERVLRLDREHVGVGLKPEAHNVFSGHDCLRP